jgi:hypothetical protein
MTMNTTQPVLQPARFLMYLPDEESARICVRNFARLPDVSSVEVHSRDATPGLDYAWFVAVTRVLSEDAMDDSCDELTFLIEEFFGGRNGGYETAARADGASWSEIGEALGESKSPAQRKFSGRG